MSGLCLFLHVRQMVVGTPGTMGIGTSTAHCDILAGSHPLPRVLLLLTVALDSL